MNPLLIAPILSLLETAIQDSPEIVTDLKAIFNNPNPTPADWEALRAKVLAKSYADYVPASALPPAANIVQLPPVTVPPAQSNAPISQPGASGTGETAAANQNPTSGTSTVTMPAPPVATQTATVAPSPYLADGTPNPAYNHKAS